MDTEVGLKLERGMLESSVSWGIHLWLKIGEGGNDWGGKIEEALSSDWCEMCCWGSSKHHRVNLRELN